jgi:hypothetical protein
MRFVRYTTAVVLIAVSTGCGDSASPVQPSAPRFDSTGLVGSGNRDGSAVGTTTASDTLTSSRDTGLVGSGN